MQQHQHHPDGVSYPPAEYVHFQEGAPHYYAYGPPNMAYYSHDDPYYRQLLQQQQQQQHHQYPGYSDQQGEAEERVPYAHVRYANTDTIYPV